ncbi:hypothetical protein [Novosphingobium sp. CF614]|uniref:hypothetical protein n=1 Tax=Novosphingobium sp. CF614 TaxID=1884364 RepID=UPI002101A414|nr:hypothetical protein [Novosphingobium sp. CF614]
MAACIVIIGIPYYWFLLDPGPDGTHPKPVTMAQLRMLADTAEGPRPSQVRVERIGHRDITRNALVAGWGLRPVRTAIRSYELVVPGGKPIVIDAGTTRAAAREFDVKDFDQSAQDRVNGALSKAGRVVLLAEGPLRDGGRKVKWAAATASIAVAPYPLAPGVVVVPTPGLGPRAKMVYVRLRGGHEFLFTGPAANVGESLRSLRPPSRLAARNEVPGYRTESKAWLTTINVLQRTAPHMTIVTAYDFADVKHAAKRFSD